MKAGVSFVGLIAAFIGAPVAAQSYDFAGDFGNAVFSYGYGYKSADGTAFTSFTPFDTANSYASGCAGVAAFACITSGGDTLTPESLPAVGINTSNAPIYPYTLSLYPGELFLHPGADPAQSVIVRFTAPRTGDYKINAYVYRIDDSGLSNGANLTTAHNGDVVQSGPLPYVFDGAAYIDRRRTLTAGDTLWYAIDNNGDVSFDSVAIFGSISAVPEPATWLMMIVGFGAIGGALRRRRFAVNADRSGRLAFNA